MQFLKKHYEKILLGVVLLGLVAAAVFLVFLVASEKNRLEELANSIINHTIKPLEPPVLTDYQVTLQRASQPVSLDLSSTNKLFNPLRWQKAADGHLFVAEISSVVKMLQVTKATPLYYTISLDTVTMTESGARYGVGVDDQGGAKPKGKHIYYASKGEKKDPFILQDVKGPADNPASLDLELADSGELIHISKDKPYKRIDGYVVDMKYPPENRTFPNKRVESTIFFGGNEYKVVAITQDEVVLSAPNQKKWTIKFSTVQ